MRGNIQIRRKVFERETPRACVKLECSGEHKRVKNTDSRGRESLREQERQPACIVK